MSNDDRRADLETHRDGLMRLVERAQAVRAGTANTISMDEFFDRATNDNANSDRDR